MLTVRDAKCVVSTLAMTLGLGVLAPTVALAQEADAPKTETKTETQGMDSGVAIEGEAVDDERARAAYQKGRALFEQRKYEESAAAFDEAYQLSKRPMLLLSIASAYERAGRFDLALRVLRAYRPHANQSNVGEVDYRIASLEERMSTVEETQSSPVAKKDAPPAERSFNYLGWGTVTVGVLAVGTGVTMIVLGEKDHQDVANAQDPQEAQDLIDSGDQKKLIGYIAAGVGTAALVAGGVFIAKGIGTHEVESDTSTTWDFAPTSGGGIVTLRGRF